MADTDRPMGTANGGPRLGNGQSDFFRGEPVGFAPPDVRSDRIGVVDVGSNSVRMVVFDGPSRTPAVLFNEKVMCGLGSELQETGRLSPGGVERALAALTRFSALAPQMRVGALAGIATAAVRDAADGPEFVTEVERRTGIRLRVATGSEEAELAAKGVLFGNPQAEGVVVDLGGASLEFCRLRNGQPETGLTTPLGPLRLGRRATKGADIDRDIRAYLGTLSEEWRLEGGVLHLVGGAFRALARAQMIRTRYPLEVLHEYELSAAHAAALGRWATEAKADDLAELRISAARRANLPFTGRLLTHLVRALGPGVVRISAFGLREGVCLETMAAGLRDADALLAGAREQERRRARAHGFGDELADWLVALFQPGDPADERLMRTAALLADVNWRTHPDYRASSCWETVTRVTLTDISHRGRVFVGAALVARYKSGRKGIDPVPAMALLTEAEQERAVQLGLALRLGSVLSGSAPGVLAYAPASLGPDGLSLTLNGPAGPFAGEEVDKRAAALARALGCGWRIDTSGIR
ncbi:MAG: exopolyphosphatase [Pseudomonadota bacterium]